jgi:hypothetical protein
VASKALRGGSDRSHWLWVHRIEPEVDQSWTNNEIAKIINEDVAEFQQTFMNDQFTVTLVPEDPKTQIGGAGTRAERGFKALVDRVLVAAYGEGHWCESEWWRKGVPLGVRKKTLERREDTSSFEEPLSFAVLFDFHDIIIHKNNWQVFQPIMRGIGFRDQSAFKSEFNKFNDLRNLTHSAREAMPTDEQLVFANEFANRITAAAESQ